MGADPQPRTRDETEPGGHDAAILKAVERAYDRLAELYDELNGVSDRAAAILAAEHFSARLQDTIIRKFARSNSEFAQRVDSGEKPFRPNPISNLAAKIEIGFALGLYDEDGRNKLHIARDVRNRFAHADQPIRFDDDWIRDQCRRLEPDVALDRESLRRTYVSFLKEM